jgi:1,2-diacylglycerol 3-alpha-glucosyltransferase
VRIGIVTKWFDRGQPVVARYLRSAFEALGHDTFVLARPKKERGPRPGALDRTDVWDQPGVTEASAYDVPSAEYAEWADANGLDAVFCDQNYQFEEIAALREGGHATIGRFVWEHFAREHVDGALAAYDIVYSFTRAEQERYRNWDIESPYVTWGIHPELLQFAQDLHPATEHAAGGRAAEHAAGSYSEDSGGIRFIFPGGFIGHRKPLLPVIEAFSRTTSPDLRLIVKAQVDRPRRIAKARELAEGDPRIEILLEDQPRAEHLRLFASCDVCVSPSRWEGLGLPLYEATAFGMPIITNDNPPMNEIVTDAVNGLLVGSHPDGETKSGLTAYGVDVDELAAAIERLADAELRERLAAGARRVREERSWDRTVTGMAELLERAVPTAGSTMTTSSQHPTRR